jgi:sensor histidine kinase YesM
MNSPTHPYAKLPISTLIVGLALFMLMMVVWLQTGYNNGQHLLFLGSSYLIWGFLLPFIQGIVLSTTFDVKGTITVAVKSLLLIILHFVLSNTIYYSLQYLLIDPFVPLSLPLLKQIIAASILSRSVDFILFFGLLSWMQRTRDLNENQLKLMRTDSELQNMRLKTLQNQLNPHFLFNTLHTVSSLIGRNDEKAREMTFKISSLLRKVLSNNESTSCTLQDEIELVQDYLAIEQERFSDRLTVELMIDDDVSDVVVPTLILQPLIENAFKHGIEHVEGNTVLSLSISRNAARNALEIVVINDLPIAPPSSTSSTGIGLTNLKERLAAYYDQPIPFSARKTNELTYRVVFTIPIES